MAHTITITTEEATTVQDVENYITSLYQRGLSVEHVTELDTGETPGESEQQHDVIATGKTSNFPKESEGKK